MTWPLATCLQYRTAFWIREGYEVRTLHRAPGSQSLLALAG